MRPVTDYDEIKEGMTLHCVSENYSGDVIKRQGVLMSNCEGYGYEPISALQLSDIFIVTD